MKDINHFTQQKNIPCEYKTNTIFRKNVRKGGKLNMNKHKAMIIPDHICQNNKKLFVTIKTRNACKM